MREGEYSIQMVTIKEIAERAGVSTTTISNVIHGKTKKVSPENVKKINDLIEELGYVQRKGFNVLHNGKSQLIAVVVNCHKTYEESLLADPFYGTVIGFIESKLRELGYYMMFYSADDIDDIFNMILTWDVDGVIAITFSARDCEKLAHLSSKPIVSIDAHLHSTGSSTRIPNIGIDDAEGGSLMVQHLLEAGYEDILVCCHKDFGNDHLRWEGAQKAWNESDSPKKHSIELISIGTSWEMRRLFYQELLRHLPFKRKTAAFFMSDYFALEAISYLSTHGITVPKDLGICGFDDTVYASRWSNPPLTTIHQSMRKKAELAAVEIVNMISDPDYVSKDIILPVSIVLRNSH